MASKSRMNILHYIGKLSYQLFAFRFKGEIVLFIRYIFILYPVCMLKSHLKWATFITFALVPAFCARPLAL